VDLQFVAVGRSDRGRFEGSLGPAPITRGGRRV
jgi:hypothetical protein